MKFPMETRAQIWQTWANTLNHWGLANFAAALLDALGPLNFFGAQLVYLSQPVLTTFASPNHLNALADMLENSQNTRAFVTALRQPERRTRV